MSSGAFFRIGWSFGLSIILAAIVAALIVRSPVVRSLVVRSLVVSNSEENARATISRRVRPIDSRTIRQENEGNLVFLSAPVTVRERLRDPLFGVTAYNALRLHRVVEMFQWVERRRFDRGKEIVSFEREWASEPVDSTSFPSQHRNPDVFPISSDTVEAPVVHCGAFVVAPALVARLSERSALAITDSSVSRVKGKKVAAANGALYVGGDPAAPEIGDMRATFYVSAPVEMSIIAKQRGMTLVPIPVDGGGELALVRSGHRTASQLLETRAGGIARGLFPRGRSAVVAAMLAVCVAGLAGAALYRTRGPLIPSR